MRVSSFVGSDGELPIGAGGDSEAVGVEDAGSVEGSLALGRQSRDHRLVGRAAQAQVPQRQHRPLSLQLHQHSFPLSGNSTMPQSFVDGKEKQVSEARCFYLLLHRR